MVIIGSRGIFLIEVKTWKGSFSAYGDRWKMRVGKRWKPLSQSPSQQSQYHQKMFVAWLRSQNLDVNPQVIAAPVVFPAAQWLGTKNCSVPVLGSTLELVQLIRQKPDCLDYGQVEDVALAMQKIAVPSQKYSIPKTINSEHKKPKPILKKKP